MKKNILTTVLIGASLFTFNAFAQAPQNPSSEKGHRWEHSAKKGAASNAGNFQKFDPFIGTTITPEQRAKIDELNKKRAEKAKADRMADMDRKKNDMAQQRKDRQAADSMRRVEKLDYLHQIRDIIGPDQYVIYLENIAVARPQGNAARPGQAMFNKNMKKDVKKADRVRKDGKRPDKK